MFLGLNLAAPGANQPQNSLLDLMRLRAGWSTGTIDANGVPTGTDTQPCKVQIPVIRGPNVQHDVIVSGNVKSVQIVGASDAAATAGRTPVNGLVQFTSSMTKLGGTIQIKVNPTGTGPFKVAIVPTKFRANYDRGELFNPDFLATLAPFTRLRFMDWSRANDFSLTDRRARLSDDTWNANGVPVEIQAALCNTAGVDMWTNIPHLLLARPDIVADLIVSARKALDPQRRLIFEVSNEVFNTGFAVHAFAVAATVDPDIWLGQQIAAVSKIIDGLGIPSAQGSVEIVIAGQAGHTGSIKQIVDTYRASGGNWGRIAAISCAPYLSSGKRADLSALLAKGDYDGAFKMFEANRLVWAGYMKEWGDYAASIGKPFEPYEINVDVETIPPNQAACQAVQFDQRAADLFSMHLDALEAAGATTAMIFNDCQAPGNQGQWGMWPWPGAEPYPIGKMVIARAAKAKLAALRQDTYAALAAEVAAMQGRLKDLAGRIAAAAVA